MSQNRDDLPYFPYYASNIIADKRYRLMSVQERAVYGFRYTPNAGLTEPGSCRPRIARKVPRLSC